MMLPKVMLTTTLIGILGLSGLAARASTKNQTNLLIPQHSNATQLAEASDGDGEMNDALETQLEKKTAQENTPTQATTSTEANNNNQTEKIYQEKSDQDGGNETQETPDEPNDHDGGNETQETH